MCVQIDKNELKIPYDFSPDFLSEKIIQITLTIQANLIENIVCDSSYLDILNKLNFESNTIKSICCNGVLSNMYSYKIGKSWSNTIFELNNLPDKLEILDLTKLYEQIAQLKNIPVGLKKLYLNDTYSYTLDNLPNTLEYLTITNKKYSSQLDCLPESLIVLELVLDNNKLSLDLLPTNITTLKLSGKYNRKLTNLPTKLKILYLPNNYTESIDNLPKSIEELKIGIRYNYLNKFKHLDLKKIHIGYNRRIGSNNLSSFILDSIPNTIEEIIFGNEFNQNLVSLPKNLKKLVFGYNFNKCICAGELPNTIEDLKFGCEFNNKICGYPSNLKYLKFGQNYNQEIKNLPDTVIHLKIGERFMEKIMSLPACLEILEFDINSEFLGDLEIIPNSVHTIYLSRYYNDRINIPKKLAKIAFVNTNKKILNELERVGYTGEIIYLKNKSI